MENNNPLSSSTTSLGSMNSSSTINSPIDIEKFQKLALNYQKIKSQNAILKKAIVQEQQKTEDLSKELKVKEQALTTAIQEHDVLDFNNQRLTKRITQLQEQMNEKKEGGSGWGFGFNSKVELQKKDDEINLLKVELQEKIDDNESLHSVTSEKENAFKSMESYFKSEIEKQNNELQEKTKKIEQLLQEQLENESRLKQQTQSLRDKVVHLEKDISTLYSSTKLRDDVLQQLNDLFRSNIHSLPSITIDYPIENVTPSNERFSFESLVLDKQFKNTNNDNDTIIDQNSWTPNIKSLIGNFQSLLSYHLSQVSTLLSSHSQKLKSTTERYQIDMGKLNEEINRLTLQNEENAFVIKNLKDDLLQREQTIQLNNSEINNQKEIIEQLNDSNMVYEKEIEKQKELYSTTKSKLEQEIKTLTINFETEMKQAKDQHQGLLKHQKHLLNSKLEEKILIITQLEKSISELKQNQLISSNSKNINSNDQPLLDLGYNTSSNSNNTSSNNLIDLSFLDTTTNSNNNNNNESTYNNNIENNLIDSVSPTLPRTQSGSDIIVGDEPSPTLTPQKSTNENILMSTTTTTTTTSTSTTTPIPNVVKY
ncbi:hypothetical protein DLAC_10446 [Tieghemostelium lacteum]|uniref:Protein phosphatase 1 regulatory subunit 21 N-terminal domain-containing protein n=1 Tax=Tieghemostelium lacteum TaxID=361077 RepID=A0A151Z5G2_TIELA|nr:hypothetical protein DLAC_10446 [Tieghemostelium lacteum]|eukprot:KYQ89202.1 hypothetical protein DLAC_10446 [Tieghemostelium lacteum]